MSNGHGDILLLYLDFQGRIGKFGGLRKTVICFSNIGDRVPPWEVVQAVHSKPDKLLLRCSWLLRLWCRLQCIRCMRKTLQNQPSVAHGLPQLAPAGDPASKVHLNQSRLDLHWRFSGRSKWMLNGFTRNNSIRSLSLSRFFPRQKLDKRAPRVWVAGHSLRSRTVAVDPLRNSLSHLVIT